MKELDQHIQDPTHLPNNPQRENKEYCESCGCPKEVCCLDRAIKEIDRLIADRKKTLELYVTELCEKKRYHGKIGELESLKDTFEEFYNMKGGYV